jgi:hypothetical protein
MAGKEARVPWLSFYKNFSPAEIAEGTEKDEFPKMGAKSGKGRICRTSLSGINPGLSASGGPFHGFQNDDFGVELPISGRSRRALG